MRRMRVLSPTTPVVLTPPIPQWDPYAAGEQGPGQRHPRESSIYQLDVPAAVCYVVPELNMNGRYATQEQIKQFFTEVPRKLTTSNVV
jgi:hypothetical protein